MISNRNMFLNIPKIWHSNLIWFVQFKRLAGTLVLCLKHSLEFEAEIVRIAT